MRLLVINDSDVLRYRIRAVLAEIPDIELIGELTDLKQATDVVRLSAPDAILVCFRRLNEPLLRSAANLRARNPESIIIALTGVLSYHTQEAWRETGVDFVLDLTMGLDLLIETLTESKSGRRGIYRSEVFINQQKCKSTASNEGV